MNEEKPLTNGNTRREEIIKEVSNCVLRDRQSSYGDAEANFSQIATRWSLYLSTRMKQEILITPFDVAAMMCDLKLSRLGTSPEHLDNWIDLAGYAVCGGGIVKSREQK